MMHIRKHYLSRAQTRAMSADMPIGDPYGGSAYGEKNVPLAAVVATGWAASAATGVAAGLLWASTALQAAALITKDEKLAKWGKYTALAGGVAALAQGAGASAGAEQASNTGTMAGTDQLTTTQTSGLADQTIAANTAGAGAADSVVSSSLAESAGQAAGASTMSLSGAMPPANAISGSLAAETAGGMRLGAAGGEAMVGGAGSGSSGIFDWIKANPGQAMTAGQAVSGAAQGAFSYMGSHKQAKESERQEEQRRADEEASRRRLNQGIIASRMPLNVRFDPNAVFNVPQQQPNRFASVAAPQPFGLIARRMV